jgi:hypothetical protein
MKISKLSPLPATAREIRAVIHLLNSRAEVLERRALSLCRRQRIDDAEVRFRADLRKPGR